MACEAPASVVAFVQRPIAVPAVPPLFGETWHPPKLIVLSIRLAYPFLNAGNLERAKRGAPIRSHIFISLNNISNILRYLYEKPSHTNRKCG